MLCEDFSLPHNQALAIGIIANELVTNSLKYAFPDEKAGHITVELSDREAIELSVSDNGFGFSATADPAGLGWRIVQLPIPWTKAAAYRSTGARRNEIATNSVKRS